MKKRIVAILLSLTIGMMGIPTTVIEAMETKQEVKSGYTYVGEEDEQVECTLTLEEYTQTAIPYASEISTNSCLEIPKCSYETYSMNGYCQYILPSEKQLCSLLYGGNLYSINYETGEGSQEYEFNPYVEYNVYKTENLLYLAYQDENDIVKVQVYDVEQHKLNYELQLKEIAQDTRNCLSAIGVSTTGDIYIASYDYESEDWSDGKVWVYDSKGTLKSTLEIPGMITSFYGFTSNGVFCYEIYYNYIYWGYDHYMAGLCIGLYEDNELVMLPKVYTNMFQWWYGEYKNAAEVLSDTLVADYLGNMYEIIIDNGEPKLVNLGAIQGRDFNNASGELGCKTLYRESDNLIIGEAEPKTLAIFDSETYEKKKAVKTSYDIYNILWCNEQICCVEKEDDKMYVEFFEIADFKEIKTEIINLNEQSNYVGRTKETISENYATALGESIHESLLKSMGSVVAPYEESVISDSGKETTMNFTNYVRWLGGLSAYESAKESAWTEAARAAVLAYAAAIEDDYYGHAPTKPSDMSDEFFESASNAIDGNLAYRGSDNTVHYAVNVIRDWNNDVLRKEATSLEWGEDSYREGIDSPTHRFSFLQRGGNIISYGFTGGTAVQKYEYAQYNPNETGTISETDNNEAAYVWPAAGYFPEEEITENAEWSINLNTDKLCLSNKGLVITITDLNTGETWVRDGRKQESGDVGMDTTNFWGYYIYFTPPEVDDYANKSFEVKIENLATADGNPAILSYTIDFFSYSDVISDPVNPSVLGDVSGDGDVKINDMLTILHGISGSQTLDGRQTNAADIDKDGKVTVRDMLRVMHYISGASSTL